jgi:hypothetical protein
VNSQGIRNGIPCYHSHKLWNINTYNRPNVYRVVKKSRASTHLFQYIATLLCVDNIVMCFQNMDPEDVCFNYSTEIISRTFVLKALE